MRRLSEAVKVDIAILPQSVSATGSTSNYFSLANYDRALFVWSSYYADGTLVTAAGTSSELLLTSVGTILQATSETGAGSAGLASSTALVSHYTKVVEFGVGPALALAEGSTLTITPYDINGDAQTALVYTATAANTATVSTGRVFSMGNTAGVTTNVSTACTNLAAILNDATYGVPNAYATAYTATVTLRSESGENMFSVTSSSTTTLTLGATKVMGMVEVNAASLTTSSSFTHVALNVVNQISALTSAFIIRGGRRAVKPVQRVGALTTVGE